MRRPRTRRIKSWVYACGAALFALATAYPANAGTLQVNPVLVQIDPDRRTATVTVTNEERVPVTIRAHALAWQQQDGEESYGETSGIIVSPPVFTIAPGATQLVRVGLRQPSAAPQAFRLIIEEVPAANPGGGVQVALRLNLPLFVMMAPGDPSGLRWSASRASDNHWTIEANNGGEGFVRLAPSDAMAATGIIFEDTVNFGTILPGATRRWRIGTSPQLSDGTRFRQIQRAGHDAPQGSH